jgi:hypothetical protein
VGTVDDRVGALEVRVGEHVVMLDGLREGMASLDRRIGSLEARMDQRFTALESRMDQQFAKVDDRLAAMDGRFVALDARLERQFQGTLGVQMTTFVALMTVFVAAFIAR